MRLEFFPPDLKPKYLETPVGEPTRVRCNTRDVTFWHLTLKCQLAVLATGKGIFYSWDCKMYSPISRPRPILVVKEFFNAMARKICRWRLQTIVAAA